MRNAFIGALLLSAVAAPALAQTAVPATAPRFVTVTDSGVLSSNLVGLNVTNAGGQTIGEIKDVAFDTNRNVEGYILSVGGFLGMSQHYVVVDPAAVAITYDATDKKWLAKMNATADQLKAAPAFEYGSRWKS